MRPAAPQRLCDKTGFADLLMISSTCLVTKCYTLRLQRHAALLEELEELSGALDDLQARQGQEERAAKAAAAEAASLREQLQALQVSSPSCFGVLLPVQCCRVFLSSNLPPAFAQNHFKVD